MQPIIILLNLKKKMKIRSHNYFKSVLGVYKHKLTSKLDVAYYFI